MEEGKKRLDFLMIFGSLDKYLDIKRIFEVDFRGNNKYISGVGYSNPAEVYFIDYNNYIRALSSEEVTIILRKYNCNIYTYDQYREKVPFSISDRVLLKQTRTIHLVTDIKYISGEYLFELDFERSILWDKSELEVRGYLF